MDNNTKPYDLGVVCGRFGHEQLGHVTLFDTCMSLCNQTLILVGSAQESGTLRNPFKVDTRIDVIKNTYPNISEDKLMIRGLNDLTNEYDITHEWGKFIKSEVESYKNKFANLIVSGDDDSRNGWFSPEDISKTKELIIPRDEFPISATQVRGMLVIDDKESWKKVTHPNIHGMYDRLRNELMEVPVYKEIYSRIISNVTLDNFMNVYKEYEIKDKQNKTK